VHQRHPHRRGIVRVAVGASARAVRHVILLDHRPPLDLVDVPDRDVRRLALGDVAAIAQPEEVGELAPLIYGF
jgi:hypothetical protein